MYRFGIRYANNKVVKWLTSLDISTDTIIHVAIRLAVFPIALLLGIIVFAFFKKDTDKGEGLKNKNYNRPTPLPRVKTVDQWVSDLGKIMRRAAKSNPESWLSIRSVLFNKPIIYSYQKLDSLISPTVLSSRVDELKNLINARFNDGDIPLEELSELLGGEKNLRSVMIAEDKLGERTVDLWNDYIAGKPVIDNLLALLSRPNIQENCAGLWGCTNLAVAFPSAKEALAHGSLDVVMQFIEDMSSLEDDESICCFYIALELLLICMIDNGRESIPSTLPMLKDSIRESVVNHPEWISRSEQFMARFLEPESAFLLQERICDALDKAWEKDPEIIHALLRSGGLHVDLNKDNEGGQTDYLSMDPYAFEHEIARLLNTQGYRMEVTTASRDGGIDILGFAPGIGEQKVAVQCKRYQGTVGRPEVQQFWGVISGSEYASGFFVTTGTFSADARQFTEDKPRLVLVDGEELATWDR